MKAKITLVAAVMPLLIHAAVPLRWTVETSRVQPVTFEAYHGETLELEATLKSYGKPITNDLQGARIYWQTNGMGSAYWSAPASASGNVLRATWTPAMDTGANAVYGFIGVAGENYRASFQLRMRSSPGAAPNELELPRKHIDFAEVEVKNAPWASATIVHAVFAAADNARMTATNALAKATAAQSSADAAQRSADAATNSVDSLKTIVISWNDTLNGSNVWFVVTNYISGAYVLEEGKLKIKEIVDGQEREIYNSRTEIRLHLDDFRDKVFEPLLAQLKQEVLAELTKKADRAWGNYTSAGGDVPDTNMVYMTAPHTVFGGGLEFERIEIGEGAIHVLASHGAPQYTAGSEGTFRFYDLQRINYFGYSSTASYTLGVNASNIIVNNGLVELHIPVVMSGHPCVYWSPELFSGILSGYDKWTQLNNTEGNAVDGAPFAVVWEQNPPEGEQICYINVADNPKGFFVFTVDVPGTASFETNMPANFEAGILCTNGINKVAIDWNGGSPRFVEVK